MERRGDEVHVDSTEASGGSKDGVVRWVLIFGTLLAIVLLSAIWMTGAAFQGEVESEGDVSGQIAAEEDDGGSNDSIVSDADQFDAGNSISADTPAGTIENEAGPAEAAEEVVTEAQAGTEAR